MRQLLWALTQALAPPLGASPTQASLPPFPSTDPLPRAGLTAAAGLLMGGATDALQQSALPGAASLGAQGAGTSPEPGVVLSRATGVGVRSELVPQLGSLKMGAQGTAGDMQGHSQRPLLHSSPSLRPLAHPTPTTLVTVLNALGRMHIKPGRTLLKALIQHTAQVRAASGGSACWRGQCQGVKAG